MAKTIQEILDERYFGSEDMIYFSDNGKDGIARVLYPYSFFRDGSEMPIDKNVFIMDMVDLRKFMSPQKNNKETFYEKMINNIDAYRDSGAAMEANRQQLNLAWRVMFDQLKTMVDEIRNEGGVVVTPNVEYFEDKLSTKPINYTDIRREFTTVLESCIVHNYIEAEKLNAKKTDESTKIKCSDEFNAYSERLASKSTSKGKGGTGK